MLPAARRNPTALRVCPLPSGGEDGSASRLVVQPALGRDPVRRDTVWQRAQRLFGLSLGDSIDTRGDSAGSAAQRAADAGLRQRLIERVTDSGDVERLATALNCLERFLLVHPRSPFLRPRGGTDDWAAAAANAERFAELELFIFEQGSRKAGSIGKAIDHGTVAGYLGALRSCAAVLTGGRTTSNDTDAWRPRLGKQIRLNEPARGPRKHRRALRDAMVLRVAHRGFDRFSHHGVTRWAVLRVGVRALLRAGEVGVTDRKRLFNLGAGLHWGLVCIQWLSAEQAGWTRPSVYLFVAPIKDQTGRAVRHEIPIPAMHAAGETSDPRCAYSALRRMWRRDAAHLTEEQRARTPMFRKPDGSPWATADVDTAVHDVARADGQDPALFGGASLRIAGATEIRAKFGLAGKDLIVARGRWKDDDIGFIYQRVTAVEQLEAMACLDGEGEAPALAPELESILQGWTQPAFRTQ